MPNLTVLRVVSAAALLWLTVATAAPGPMARAEGDSTATLFELSPANHRGATAAANPTGGRVRRATAPGESVQEEEPAEVVTASLRVHGEVLASARPGTRLRLDVGEGVSSVGEVTDVHTTALRGRRVVAGRLRAKDGKPGEGDFLLVTDAAGQEVAGTFTLPSGQPYSLGRARGARGGGPEFEVRRQTAAPAPCGGTAASHPAAEKGDHGDVPAWRRPQPRAENDPPADPPTRFDLLIAYTAAARERAGGTEAMELLCEVRVEVCNRAYANSGLDLRARLAHTMETAYRERGTVVADLNAYLTTSPDPAVTAALDLYGADFLTLVVVPDEGAEGSDVPGVADGVPGVFNVCSFFGRSPSSVLAHELGHGMGCGHDRANAGQAEYPYSCGWSWTGLDGFVYGDVMSYVGSRLPLVFSNPNLLYQGVPAGDFVLADNARTIRENAARFCNHRRTTIAARPLVSLTLPEPEAVKETGRPARLRLTRTGTDLSRPLDVRLETAPVSLDNASRAALPPAADQLYFVSLYGDLAIAGRDYVAPPAVVTIPAGADGVGVPVPPLADPARRRPTDRPESVGFALVPGEGYDVGLPLWATVRVFEHDLAVSLSPEQATATQNPPQEARITARRAGASASAPAGAPLSFTPEILPGGDAVEGQDFVVDPPLAGPAPVFAPGTDRQEFTVRVLPGAALPARGKRFFLTVGDRAAANVYHYDPTRYATVILRPAPISDATPAAVSLTLASYADLRVVEGGGKFKVRATRAGGDLSAPLTVAYKVSGPGAGRLGAPGTGTVTFPAGSVNVKIRLQAPNDGVAAPEQAFKVKLLAGAGYTLGSLNKVNLVVVDPLP